MEKNIPRRFFAAAIIALFVLMAFIIWAAAKISNVEDQLQQACAVLQHHSLTVKGC